MEELYEEEREEELEFKEKIVSVSRVAKVVQGGKRFGFNALVVVGDGKGRVGYALGKAREAPDAIRKAIEKAKKNLIKVPIINDTIPYEVKAKFCSAVVLLKPALPGTGVIAGGTVRAIAELAGIKNLLTKSLRSHNPHNLVKAVFKALSQLKYPEEIAEERGIPLEKLGYKPVGIFASSKKEKENAGKVKTS